MKIDLFCHSCPENGHNIEHKELSLEDSNIYNFTCTNGHATLAFLNNQRYEILFEKGVENIRRENFNEAIYSFYVSLERFFEFCIEVFINSDPARKQIFLNIWKIISNKSERQLGAFLALWTYVMNESPSLLSDKQINLRNNVIHKGTFVSKEKALKFGGEVGIVIQKNLNNLKKFRSCMDVTDKQNLIDLKKKKVEYQQIKINSFITSVFIEKCKDFEEKIKKYYRSSTQT